jgi:hypothetical protein
MELLYASGDGGEGDVPDAAEPPSS